MAGLLNNHARGRVCPSLRRSGACLPTPPRRVCNEFFGKRGALIRCCPGKRETPVYEPLDRPVRACPVSPGTYRPFKAQTPGQERVRVPQDCFRRHSHRSHTCVRAGVVLMHGVRSNTIRQILPSEFVEVIGEEASRHSQLVCHVRSERSVTAIRVLVIRVRV